MLRSGRKCYWTINQILAGRPATQIVANWPMRRDVPPALPNLDHYRGHGIDRARAWCSARGCIHEGVVTFAELEAHGASGSTKLKPLGARFRCTVCGGLGADVRPDWSQIGGS